VWRLKARRTGTDVYIWDHRGGILAIFPKIAERATLRAAALPEASSKMLAIGRALMTNPRMLIPTSHEGPPPLRPRRDRLGDEGMKASGMAIR